MTERFPLLDDDDAAGAVAVDLVDNGREQGHWLLLSGLASVVVVASAFN
jgi:hypothetical protein